MNKIDFVAIISAENCNPNGDPMNGNYPRIDVDDKSFITSVCIKRKLRNRMQDMGQKIYIQSDSRIDDGFTTLSQRANSVLSDIPKPKKSSKKNKSDEEKDGESILEVGYKHMVSDLACKTWLDVRTFGQVFAGAHDSNAGIKGAVSIRTATSVSEVDIDSYQITKSTSINTERHDTMGMTHVLRHGVYKVCGSISAQLAEKTGFSEADAEILKECLRTMFVNDFSSARPEGSMEVIKLYWFDHNCKDGKASSAKVHRSVSIIPTCDRPRSIDDYEISVTPIGGITCTEYEGV